jgi:hypothetical protein
LQTNKNQLQGKRKAIGNIESGEVNCPNHLQQWINWIFIRIEISNPKYQPQNIQPKPLDALRAGLKSVAQSVQEAIKKCPHQRAFWFCDLAFSYFTNSI